MSPPLAPDPVAAAESPLALAELNRWLGTQSAPARIAWALRTLAGPHVLSSSFGAQSAVALHMATQAKPDIPVVLVDTVTSDQKLVTKVAEDRLRAEAEGPSQVATRTEPSNDDVLVAGLLAGGAVLVIGAVALVLRRTRNS